MKNYLGILAYYTTLEAPCIDKVGCSGASFAVGPASQGDHKGAPLQWYNNASLRSFIVGAHPCGRPGLYQVGTMTGSCRSAIRISVGVCPRISPSNVMSCGSLLVLMMTLFARR